MNLEQARLARAIAAFVIPLLAVVALSAKTANRLGWAWLLLSPVASPGFGVFGILVMLLCAFLLASGLHGARSYSWLYALLAGVIWSILVILAVSRQV